MRIVIAGGGEIAFQIAQQLSLEQDIVIIEADRDAAGPFDRLDVQIVLGNPASTRTLRQIRLGPEDKFIACSESDEQNIIACLSVKPFGAPQTFCFVSKEEYYQSFSGSDGDAALPEIDSVIWPQFMLAKEISRIVAVPEAIDVEVFARGRIWLTEYRLEKDSRLIGKPLRDQTFPKGVLAVTLVRGNELHIPTGATRFAVDDKVVFMGRRRPLMRLSEEVLQRGIHKVTDVTIVGGGNVGLALAKLLERESMRLRVIELSHERCEQIAAELPRTLVIHGNGTDVGLLRAEHVDRTEVLVSVTSEDDRNLLCSLIARQMQIPKIITRVNEPANVRLFESVGIDVPLNPRVTAINAVLGSMYETEVELLATLEQGEAQVVELRVPDDFPVTKVRNLRPVEGAIIGAILRGWRSIVPHGDDYVKSGDRLLVVSTKDAKAQVEEYF